MTEDGAQVARRLRRRRGARARRLARPPLRRHEDAQGRLDSGELCKHLSDLLPCSGAWWSSGWRFNSIKKGTEKRTEKGPESKFATIICMNSEKEPGLYRFGPIFTKEISILIQ